MSTPADADVTELRVRVTLGRETRTFPFLGREHVAGGLGGLHVLHPRRDLVEVGLQLDDQLVLQLLLLRVIRTTVPLLVATRGRVEIGLQVADVDSLLGVGVRVRVCGVAGGPDASGVGEEVLAGDHGLRGGRGEPIEGLPRERAHHAVVVDALILLELAQDPLRGTVEATRYLEGRACRPDLVQSLLHLSHTRARRAAAEPDLTGRPHRGRRWVGKTLHPSTLQENIDGGIANEPLEREQGVDAGVTGPMVLGPADGRRPASVDPFHPSSTPEIQYAVRRRAGGSRATFVALSGNRAR